MKSMVRKKLLDAFREANGEFLSGEKIAKEIGCSRTAVWKHIEELRKEGFQLEAVRKKGYRLNQTANKMNENDLYLGLETKTIGRTIHVYETVTTTQKIAHELAINGAKDGTLIIADEQTMGRGRLGRNWHSKKGTGIWMSLIIKPEISVQKAPQFTLLTAVALCMAIEEVTGLEPFIKWPNDLLLQQKKVAGILTELIAEENRVQAIIIGIGINVNHTETDFPEELRDKATSLAIEKGTTILRPKLVQNFCLKFEKLYETYNKTGFQPIKLLWESYNISIGKKILARTNQRTIVGTALGINEDGVLLLEDEHGHIHHIYSADIDIQNDSR